MALPYKQWTDEEIKDRNVIPEGEYNFTITNAIRSVSKQKFDNEGNPKPKYEMLELDFEYADANGIVKKQRDWIVFAEGMDWKLAHLANTTGTWELYIKGELDCHHLRLKKGKFRLGVKTSEYNGEERKQNFVKDYVKKEVALSNVNIVKNDDLNDDLPF